MTAGTYIATACHTCKRSPPEEVPSLMVCSGCKRFRYCSPACQAMDFKKMRHKQVCKNLKAFDKALAEQRVKLPLPPKGDSEGIVAYQRAVGAFLSTVAPGHTKGGLEFQALTRGRMCTLCYQSPAGAGLRDCPSCCSVSWCESCEGEARTLHAPSCELLGRFRQRALVLAREQIRCGIAAIAMVQPTREEVYSPLPGGWEAYEGRRAVPAYPREVLDCATGVLSHPLSIVWGLERLLPSTASLQDLEYISLHLVGAEDVVECLALVKYEEILHLLPACKRLDVAFVGPECSRDPMDAGYLAGEMCPACSPRGQEIRMTWHSVPYHEYRASEAPGSGPPTLAVAFNSGMHDPAFAEAWAPTVADLAARGTRCLFTSYTQREALYDQEVLESHGVPVTVLPQRNPFGSLIDCREPFHPLLPKEGAELEEAFYSPNRWVLGVAGKGPEAGIVPPCPP